MNAAIWYCNTLDELEYLLSGPYPGVLLAIEGKLPFQGLEERLHEGPEFFSIATSLRSSSFSFLSFSIS